MWKILTLNENYYLFRLLPIGNEVIIHVTDLKLLWTCQTTKTKLVEQFIIHNPLCAKDAEDVNKLCFDLLNDDCAIKNVEFDDNADNCFLHFKTFLEELPLKLHINLTKQSQNDYFQHITIPMVQTLQYLELKQKKLEIIMAKKDKELLEYKLEFGTITRKLVETEKYVPDTEVKQDLLLKVFSVNENFTNLFATHHGDVQQLFPEVKEEKPQNRKLELAPAPKRICRY